MDIFLDTSVLISACASGSGVSRYILERRASCAWNLTSVEYCREEVRNNLQKFPESASTFFRDHAEPAVHWLANVFTAREIVIYEKTKDRPVLLGALAAKADVLLTLDRADFHNRLGAQFYGISIRTPGEWLFELRAAGSIQPDID